MENSVSKKLGHDDESGFHFAQEMLGENTTAAVNFDRLQKHPEYGYIIFEYLMCDESQNVTPYTSHPNRYWNKNRNKFLSLWRAKLDFRAKLYLVNYAKKGTRADDEILLIEVLDVNENGIIKEQKQKYTRQSFMDWFVKLNNECLNDTDTMLYDIYSHKSFEEVGGYTIDFGKYKGKTLSEIRQEDFQYLDWIIENQVQHYHIVKCYLEKMRAEGMLDIHT